MNKHSDLEKLVQYHLDSTKFNDKDTVQDVALSFLCVVDSFIKTTEEETFYNLPYKEISKLIFENTNSDIGSNTYEGFKSTVAERISEIYNDDQGAVDASLAHIISCYEKFSQHIELAQVQKDYMQSLGVTALKISNDAKQKANYAKRQAQKAKNLTQKMVANYVSILGIFATIIIAVFGGINLISSTVKLLEDNSRLSYLVFVVSFLMACLLTLIRILTTWISSVNSFENEANSEKNNFKVGQSNKVEASDTKKWCKKFCKWVANLSLYTKAMSFLLILIAGSLLCIIFYASPESKKDNNEMANEKFHNQSTTGINININPEEKKNAP